MAVNVGSAIAYLELDTSKFSKGFASAFNDLKVFGSKTATVEQKLGGLQSAFKTTGGMLSKSVTLPLVGVGVASTKMASDFEQGMAEVQAISGASAKQLEQLKDKAIEMGAKTKFSASESAEAFKYMAMAGWETEDMLDGITGIMDLAAASGEELGLVSDIVTDSLTAFGLSAKDSAHFADVLAKASSKSNTNVSMMGETFQYVAPVAGALGYSVEDTAVAIGLMANAGIKGSQAGTALRGLLTRLVKPTDQVADAMSELGINITNADGSMKPFNETMLMLRDKFDGLSESEKAQYAATLAGQEGMSGLLAIINASDEDFAKLIQEINNADGASQDMAETMMNTTQGAVEQLKGALESAGIMIGERLTPYIKKLADFITKLVEKFNALSEKQQDSIVKWGLIIAAIGPVLLILSKLISFIMMIVKIVKFVVTAIKALGAVFGALATPVGIAVAAVGAVIAVFVLLWNKCDAFREFWINLWDNIVNIVMSVKDSIVNFFTVTIPTAIDNFISIIPEKIEAIKQWFAQLPYNLGVFVGEMIGHIYMFGQNIADWIANDLPVHISNIVNWFATLPSRIWEWLCNVVHKIIEWGSNIVSEGRTAVTNFIDTFISFLKQLPSKVWGIIKQIPEKVRQIGSSLKQAGADIFNNLWDGIKSIGESILGWVSDFAGKIGDFVSGIVQGFKNIVSGADEAKSAARSVDGSHANGLDYVPFNGYIAELHKGERVLTAQENKEYNKGRGGSGSGDTYNFYNTKPTPYEYARQMKKAKKELLYGI